MVRPQQQRRRKGGKKTSSSKGAGKSQRRSRHFYDVRLYALLQDDNSNLLILQLPGEYDEGAANTWTLPGGKLEPADEPGEGLLREITEETGLKAELLGPCTLARWATRNSKKLAVFYRARVEGTKPALKLSGEHQRAIWINADEVKEFPFHRQEMLQTVQKILSPKEST